FEVLGEVAVGAGRRDRLDDRGALRARELGELGAEPGVLRSCQALVHGHSGAGGSQSPRWFVTLRALAALDDVVNLEDVWLACELDSGVGQHWRQPFAERGELFPRVPDLADLEVAVRTEADVVVEPVGRKIAGFSNLLQGLVV